MLTLFTTPKPFRGPFATIQRNALRSWARLAGAREVLIFGDEDGTSAVAADLGLHHVPDIARHEGGMPLVSSLMTRAREIATTPFLGYANADLIFMDDLTVALRRAVSFSDRFLLIGQRYNADVTAPLDFEGAWDVRLRQRVIDQGYTLCAGVDYFLFPRGLWDHIPDTLVVGRAGWDNWPVYEARLLKAPVIDATPVVMAVHQNHDYSHHPGGWAGVYEGVDATRNYAALGGRRHMLNALDATHLMTADDLHVRCRSCYPMCVCKPASF